MKKTRLALLLTALFLVVYLFNATALPFFPNRSAGMTDKDCLIQTSWQQMGGFQACTPDSLRLGCWSTALAQIAYYHRLKPFGTVAYTSRQGYRIHEKLDTSRFDFALFRPDMASASPEGKAQMARYNYYAALAMQKDFGTDRYMNKLAPASLLEQHYPVQAKRLISWRGVGPYTMGKLEKVIYNELRNKRPVFLHFANLKDFGHSVVVDGYRYQNGSFWVHLNQGQGGPTDGWYAFHKGILRPDDDALRVVYTLRPL